MTPISNLTTPVHLKTNHPDAKRTTAPPTGQPFPLNEPGLPFNYSNVAAVKINQVSAVIDYLEVNKPTYLRYTPSGGNTFCNIYAYDLAYLMGAKINKYFVPRVWWKNPAITNINNGVPQEPAYGTTVDELDANSLYQWFRDYGGGFGWVRQSDLTALQNQVNTSGDIGIIVGKKNGGHGHITVVVPEASALPAGLFAAERNAANKVINPLQSQAGASNFKYGYSKIGGQPWFLNGHTSDCYMFL